MKLLILTTETKHHTYFINKLSKHFDIVAIVYERFRLVKGYPTEPFFSDEQEQYEEKFFHSNLDSVSFIIPESLNKKIVEVYRVNEPGMAGFIKELKPDIIITYGVGIVKPFIFSLSTWGTINVHRGIVQEFRGLDSDLWAIYYKKCDKIGVTIHYVDEGLDTGDILAQEYVRIEYSDEIYHFRYKTSVLATKLVESLLFRFKERGCRLEGNPQKQCGPYYSAMSLEQKYRTLECFREYKELLLNSKVRD